MKKVISILLSVLFIFTAFSCLSVSAIGEQIAPVNSGKYCESGEYYDLREIENYSFVTVGEAPKAITFNEAYSIQCHHMMFSCQSLENKELEAQIKEAYIASLSGESLTADELSIKYYGTLSDGTMLLDIEGPYGYFQVISATVIDKYLYVQSDSNEYEVYKDGKFSYIYDEYENGHLTGELLDETAELLQFASFADEDLELCGDADSDGALSVKDATHVQKYLAGLISEQQINYSVTNVSGTGTVTIRDATLIQKHLVGVLSE